MQQQQINIYAGMTDGVLGSNPSITRGTLPSYYSRESGRNTQEPTPLYDVDYYWLEGRMPPALAFFDQFSAPGSALHQVDIFWVDSNSFIICSAQALVRFKRLVTALKEHVPRKSESELSANLFTRHGTCGTHSKYLGLFELTCTLRRTKLSNTDPHASATALRVACGENPMWKPARGIQDLGVGREAEVYWMHVEHVKDDLELLGALRPVGWIRPAASLAARPSSVKSLPSTATIFSPMY